MKNVKVIPHRYYEHISGRKASIYGAAPWTSAADEKNWKRVEKGYTWEITSYNGNVTIGACRRPVATREEAEAIAEKLRAL